MSHSPLRVVLRFCSLLALGMLFTGCAGKPVNESDPKEMYEDADQDVLGDRFLLALDKLRVVKSKFSYTSYGALAQLRIGDVYFLQESYPEAASAYEAFIELYPRHERAAYALFRAGESYYNDIPSTIARDLKSAESAVSTLTLYLKKYPTGEFRDKAADMKQKSYNKMAEKELDIGKFYIRRKKPGPARIRLNKVVEQFGDSEAAHEAKQLLETLPNE